MPLPERIPNPSREPISELVICELAHDWGIRPELASRIVTVQGELPFDIWIFSGARSRKEQANYGLAFDRSTHADHDATGCPRLATGVDMQPVSPGVRLSRPAVAQLGAAAVRAGLRWGGGAPVDDVGIPVGNERWHFDLGPREPP